MPYNITHDLARKRVFELTGERDKHQESATEILVTPMRVQKQTALLRLTDAFGELPRKKAPKEIKKDVELMHVKPASKESSGLKR
jgi:hypothetical protein